MTNSREKPQLLRKPPWLKVRLPHAQESRRIRTTLAGLKLHTVCQEAACPNIAECFAGGTATFLILGNICTRNCLYCNVQHGAPLPVEEKEVDQLIAAVQEMKLKYIVITSVTRDDLSDGGAVIFADCIKRLRVARPECKIEVLIPDFQGNVSALEKVIEAHPDVINHNMETVRKLFPRLRPQGNYDSHEPFTALSQTSAFSPFTRNMIGVPSGMHPLTARVSGVLLVLPYVPVCTGGYGVPGDVLDHPFSCGTHYR